MKTYRIKKNNKVISSGLPEEGAMRHFLNILNQGEDVKQTWVDINDPNPVECRGDRYQITEEEKNNHQRKVIVTITNLPNGATEYHTEIVGEMSLIECLGALEIAKTNTIKVNNTYDLDNVKITPKPIENKLNHDANI